MYTQGHANFDFNRCLQKVVFSFEERFEWSKSLLFRGSSPSKEIPSSAKFPIPSPPFLKAIWETLCFIIIYIPLMTSNMANDNSSNNEEQIIDNTLDQNDNTIIGISDDLHKLKTKVIA